jgi:hypothetical protein
VAPKLVALKELLLQCGMGSSTATEDEGDGTDADGDDAMDDVDGTVPAAMAEQRDVPRAWADAPGPRHRALIFAQLTATLDLVESDLFRRHLPRLKYLRMHGGQNPAQRFELVQQFNADESIECLLLTTHVGGLGLNLTGADTVIFLEHDYNPMQDLQAMDRAHRIGQTRVVNVYRIITEGTLEERIMGLQRFKLNVANTVVSQDNASLRSMEAGSVLDLVLPSAVCYFLSAVYCGQHCYQFFKTLLILLSFQPANPTCHSPDVWVQMSEWTAITQTLMVIAMLLPPFSHHALPRHPLSRPFLFAPSLAPTHVHRCSCRQRGLLPLPPLQLRTPPSHFPHALAWRRCLIPYRSAHT